MAGLNHTKHDILTLSHRLVDDDEGGATQRATKDEEGGATQRATT